MSKKTERKAAEKAAKKEIDTIIKKYRPKWHQRLSHKQVVMGTSTTMSAIGAVIGTAAVIDPTGSSGLAYFVMSGWFAMEARGDKHEHENKVFENSANQKVIGKSNICLAISYIESKMQQAYKFYDALGDEKAWTNKRAEVMEHMCEMEKDTLKLIKYMHLTDADDNPLKKSDYAFCMNKDQVLKSIGAIKPVSPKMFADLKAEFTKATTPKPKSKPANDLKADIGSKPPKKLGR